MPRLWNDTIAAHRRDVREAVIDATAALVAERGLLSVTMSEIAERTGIGRATLYKYFPDVEAILLAWHERQVAEHLRHLAEVSARPGAPAERLQAVLAAYALIAFESRRHHDSGELASVLHQGQQAARGEHQLRVLIRDLLAEGAAAGSLRSDVPPEELAGYCLHALSAAGGLSSRAAVHRLVSVTLAGVQAGE